TGAIFGIAGLARTETFLFLAAASLLAYTWHRPRPPFAPLAAGFGTVGFFALLLGAQSPSHHLAYLRNDLLLHYYLIALPLLWKARDSGALAAALVAITAVFGAAAVAGARTGVGAARALARVATLGGALAAI